MLFTLTRFLTYLTLFMYLMVGVIAVRVLFPETTTIEVSRSYLGYFSKTHFKSAESITFTTPEINFAEIKFPSDIKRNVHTRAVSIKTAKKVGTPVLKVEDVSKHQLLFHEAVVLRPVFMANNLPVHHVALFNEFNYQSVAAIQEKKTDSLTDEVSTKLAASTEPDFFEYPTTETKAPQVEASVKTVTNQSTKDEKLSTNSDDSLVVDESSQNVENITEEVAVDELITFDYSKVGREIKAEKVPMISSVTTQHVPAPSLSVATPAKVQKGNSKTVTTQKSQNQKSETQDFLNTYKAPKTFQNRVSIQVTGTDLVKTENEAGFEIRPQDDLGESVSDYNSGEAVLDHEIAQAKMTRSITVLKRGFVPTNTDLILEDGGSEITLPLITEAKFNELLAPYESRGPIGAVLVELDDEVEIAALDVPYSKVITLDEKMNKTEDRDFSYQLFIGVKAGNSLLSYKSASGEVTSKIIHIHDHELTFETNFFENVSNERVSLVEEDLLSQEKHPLIISSEEVRQFASDKTAKKINNHTFETQFNKTLLGGRKYLELAHQAEPVFVGYKDASILVVPSENFMRYILSRFEGGKLGNRCLLQVNLSKKALKVDLASESVDDGLQTYIQVLDSDGKFYDSVGDKTQKVIVVGESQGSFEQGQDAKINFKVTYQDGSVQFIGSYCSPNTYLVEQL
jgi:hypothetical protein